jgi:hypothetical protein
VAKNNSISEKLLFVFIIVIGIGSVYYVSNELRYALMAVIILEMIILGVVWSVRNELKEIFKK